MKEDASMSQACEWHIHTKQQTLLDFLCTYWWERGCSVTIEDGPQDGSAWSRLEAARLEQWTAGHQIDDLSLVYATDPAGWTIVVPENKATWDDDLWKWLTWETQAPLLAGYYFSVVGMSHWAWFERAQLQA